MTTRRKFLQTSAALVGATAFSASSYARILGANDRINLGFMGTNSRGASVLKSFVASDGKGINITHNCDVDSRVLSKTAGLIKSLGYDEPKSDKDIRKILEDKTLDAVYIAAPDHWHAPAGIMALEAGKHVYVEKPLSHNPHEGEMFIAAQNKYGKVVQMGNQQRSSIETLELKRLIDEGVLGNVYRAETWYSNKRGSIGNGKVADVPDWLDWDLWQGPAPRTAYRDNLVHYNWHWFWHWGTAELCNNAAHELDVARLLLDVELPEKVSVEGGRHFYTTDDWEMYDTIEAQYKFAGGKSIEWSGHSCNKAPRWGRSRGTIVYGTKGHAIVDRAGFELYDLAGKLIKEVTIKGKAATSSSDLAGGGSLTDNHTKNFLDTIRGTASKQSSPVEVGHTSTMLCHLGNIAYRTGEDVIMNTETGKAKNKAAQKLWGRTHQSGWDI